MVRARALGALGVAVAAAAVGVLTGGGPPRLVFERRLVPLSEKGVPLPPSTMSMFAMPKVSSEVREDTLSAVKSWSALGQEVILLGDTLEAADLAREAGVGEGHRPIGIRCNSLGTPLVDDIFRAAHAHASHDILAYVNADIVLGSDFVDAAETAKAAFKGGPYLVVGRRTDVRTRGGQEQNITACDVEAGSCGRLHPATGKDWFVFSRAGVFDDSTRMPPFSLGRTIWDNWLVADALRRGIPVIDASDAVLALHLEHGYEHRIDQEGSAVSTPEGKLAGREAEINRVLAGGSELVLGGSIGAATHRLTLERRGDEIWHALSERRLRVPLLTWVSDLSFFLTLPALSDSQSTASPYLAIAKSHGKALLRCAFPSGLVSRDALRVGSAHHLAELQRGPHLR